MSTKNQYFEIFSVKQSILINLYYERRSIMAKPISEDKRDIILNGNLFHAILMLAIPVMINSFIQSMYNLTDTSYLSKPERICKIIH